MTPPWPGSGVSVVPRAALLPGLGRQAALRQPQLLPGDGARGWRRGGRGAGRGGADPTDAAMFCPLQGIK